jgi:hypothetical protein
MLIDWLLERIAEHDIQQNQVNSYWQERLIRYRLVRLENFRYYYNRDQHEREQNKTIIDEFNSFFTN